MIGTKPASRARASLVHLPVDRSRLARRLVRVAPAEQQPPSSSRQYRPQPMSKTIGIRSTSNASCGSRTATVWRAAPAGIGCRPSGRPHGATARRSAGPGSWRSARGSSRRRRPAGRRPASARGAGPRTPSAPQLDARRLHGQRVGTDVARRVDAAVGREVAAAAVTVARERWDHRDRLVGGEPGDVEALARAASTPLAAGPLVVLGDGEDQVAELAEAGVRAEVSAWRR